MIKLFNQSIEGLSMKKRVLLPLVLGLAAMGLFLTHQLGVLTVQAKTEETLILEVAIDGRTSVLNRVDPSATAPARGDTGIVNGYIFPEGTIPPGDNGFDLDAPEKVGDWVAVNIRGALPAPRNAAVTYYFAMPDLETAGLITQGFNSHRFPGSIPVAHAIVGGTGVFSGQTGEVIEEVIGKNKTGAFNLRYHIKIKKQAPK
jgi:hypothetical protein